MALVWQLGQPADLLTPLHEVDQTHGRRPHQQCCLDGPNALQLPN